VVNNQIILKTVLRWDACFHEQNMETFKWELFFSAIYNDKENQWKIKMEFYFPVTAQRFQNIIQLEYKCLKN
jgi:hypothetical protein